MWHCPHCGAPQAETARCWVCRKSSTTCSTCRHFRPSLASEIGYCALDRARRPLTGLELRGCWTERPAGVGAEAASSSPPAPGFAARRGDVPARGFVPLDEVAPREPDPGPAVATAIILLADGFGTGETRTSLFGEPER